MPTMSKTEIVLQTKRANTRLKPVGDVCLAIAQRRRHRPLPRERALMLARLERELKEDDAAGPNLRDAVAAFWQATDDEVAPDRMLKYAEAVYRAVRRVQSDRWLRIEEKYGKVSHYFDGFGQVKPHYRARQARRQAQAEQRKRRPWRIGVGLLVITGIAALAWWFA